MSNTRRAPLASPVSAPTISASTTSEMPSVIALAPTIAATGRDFVSPNLATVGYAIRVNEAQNEPISSAGRGSMPSSSATPVPSAMGSTAVSRPNPPEMTR
jgi:hypothetical protein